MPSPSTIKTVLTVLVDEADGISIPYIFATFPKSSAIIGNVIIGLFMLFQLYFAISLVHAICEVFESTERPSSEVLFAAKRSFIEAKVIISVVHTGVKSPG